MHRFLQRAPRIATWAVYMCFACRILVPAGYMPASLSDGGPFVLCPGGFQGELLQFLGANDHPHHAAAAAEDDAHAATQHAHDGWTHCSIGTSLSSIALASTPLPLPALSLVSPPPSISIRTLATATAVPHQQIRAPPPLLSA